ncbi:MAG TPA: hypothetical protein PK012_34395, partial [Blastocatellia bacterium]|nr:hypothetical protein [Blastocatellia bacterium]
SEFLFSIEFGFAIGAQATIGTRWIQCLPGHASLPACEAFNSRTLEAMRTQGVGRAIIRPL